jgi:LPXTG-motif cell wall-anchored protein
VVAAMSDLRHQGVDSLAAIRKQYYPSMLGLGSSCRRRLLVVCMAGAMGMPVAGPATPVGAQVCPDLWRQGDLTTQLTVDGVDLVAHHFTTPGHHVFTPPPTITQVDYLVVGGGGGGGARYGGGGGGGGVLSGTLAVTAGVGTGVTVGAGGVGGVKRSTGVSPGRGSNGFSSVLGTLEAFGGGGGGGGNQGANGAGRSGASGGGGGGVIETSTVLVGGSATQGFSGGNGSFGFAGSGFSGLTAGGGGGAGGAGGNSIRVPILAGAGGLGIQSSISGVSLGYAGGGGGGSFQVNAPNTGRDGGGDGTNTDTQPAKATRGGGGGGGGLSTQGWDGSAGGDGGDGLVIVRYVAPPLRPCAPTVTSVAARDGAALVSFTSPSFDGGSTITNYEYSSDGGQNWAAFSPPVVTSPVLITGLVNATVSSVVLRAVNIMGSGSSSNMVQVIPQGVVPPPPSPMPLDTTLPPTSSAPPTTVRPAPVTTAAPTTSTIQPNLQPGEVLVLRNGVPVDTMVLATEASSLTMLHGGTELRVSARCDRVCPLTTAGTNGGRAIEVSAGAELLVTATGLLPGALVDVWVFSDPQLLANKVLGDDGSYVGVVPLRTVAPGEHTLQVNSTGPTGDRLSFHLSLIVREAESGLVVVLPRTGSEPTLVIVALALVLSVGGVVLVSRKRRATVPPG